MLLNMLRGFTAQAALDAPRFCISAGLVDSGTENAGDINSEVYCEEGIHDETVATLRGQFYAFTCPSSLSVCKILRNGS